MIPVQPEELSALIDEELDSQRSHEVEIQIAADQDLRATFEALRELDSAWRAAARTIVSDSQARLPARAGWNGWSAILLMATVLVGMRITARAIDTTTIAFAFQALALVALLVGVARLGWSDVQSRS
jgi:anti-sigma factor RsiW